ncbi:MAG: aspartate aminotransferase family protein [SAR324 cluster bacterium]|nr:aspartate aminotransferase family protein [SAR324 cluster bacterium]
MLDIAKSNHWLPFTAIKSFSQRPIIVKEARGMYYTSSDDRKILDATAGLWCVNAGHSRKKIAAAMYKQAKEMSYAPSFQISHPGGFEFAERLAEIAPPSLNRIFFTNSGSESVDTALKIALGYFKTIGKGAKTRLIGREKGYHGVGFGGLSVGGIVGNRRQFSLLLPGVDHLPHTLNTDDLFCRGLPPVKEDYASALLKLIELHDASNIAAVIVEPIAGSAGVILPPDGYLRRLREICDQHDILLIFDEVITGFGRIGDAFAAQRFGVVPDIMVTAKGLTNGAIPMGAVFVKKSIYDSYMDGTKSGIELAHGYTYSASPVACAVGLATLDIYQDEKLFERSRKLESYFANKIHSLKGMPHVKRIRNFGLVGAIDLEPREGALGSRGYEAFTKAFFEQNILIRATGDTLAFSPPLIIEKNEIDMIFEKVGNTLSDLS